MTIKTVLSDAEIGKIADAFFTKDDDPDEGLCFARDVEQAVLQSPEIQRLLAIEKAAQEVLDYVEIKHRPPVRQTLEKGELALVRVHALVDLQAAMERKPQCEYCGGSGDVHSIDGEWRGICTCKSGDAIRTAMEYKAKSKITIPEPINTWYDETEGLEHGMVTLTQLVTYKDACVREALQEAGRRKLRKPFIGWQHSDIWDRFQKSHAWGDLSDFPNGSGFHYTIKPGIKFGMFVSELTSHLLEQIEIVNPDVFSPKQ